MKLPRDQWDMWKAEQDAAMEASLAAGEAQREAKEREEEARREFRSRVPGMAGAPAKAPPLPPGETLEGYLMRAREADLPRRAAAVEVRQDLGLPESALHIYRLLIAHSQPRRGLGAGQWRTVFANEITPYEVLGIDPPTAPPYGHRIQYPTDPTIPLQAAHLTIGPEISAEDWSRTSRALQDGLAVLEQAGFYRTLQGPWGEICLDALL
jgi:hypothetical protein